MAYNAISVRPKPYLVNNYKGFANEKEDNDASQPSRAHQYQEEQYPINQNNKKDIQQQLAESKEMHQAAVASRDATLKNATVNIAQIIKDFKGTVKAIGASPELAEEVDIYLALVEKQVTKDNPDIKLVRSNLKNASSLLDAYITETLQRPSKVVENWIDALFLQQINYKFNEEEVNPHFLVKFPGQKNEDENKRNNSSDDGDEDNNSKENEEKTNSKPSLVIPEDEKLKSLFVQAKKYTYADNSKKAMELFKEALDRAVEIQDNETGSKILFEIGKIYDKHDYLAQALTSYNKSLITTNDSNVKTKAHYSMAQIYDDVAQFEPAINHYLSSISYAGVSENLIAQSTSLTRIGNIYSDEYRKEAFDFLLEADLIAAETDSAKIKGYVSSNIANAYNKFNEPQKALKFYSSAAKEYQDAKDSQKVAINYKRAAELMQDYKNIKKAKVLFQKALEKARQTDDVNLMTEIHEALNMI